MNKAEFLARRNVKENIYNLAQFENINTTFPETEAIIDTGKSVNADDYDVKVIIGLKHGWQKVLDADDEFISTAFVKNINKTIGEDLVINPGEFRTKEIGVGGVTNKIPPISESDWDKQVEELNNIKDPKDRAIRYLIFSITFQPFMDGNKRTAFLVANEVLISNNIGVLFPNKTAQNALDFSKALNNYYNDKSDNNYKKLYDTIDSQIELVD